MFESSSEPSSLASESSELDFHGANDRGLPAAVLHSNEDR